MPLKSKKKRGKSGFNRDNIGVSIMAADKLHYFWIVCCFRLLTNFAQSGFKARLCFVSFKQSGGFLQLNYKLVEFFSLSGTQHGRHRFGKLFYLRVCQLSAFFLCFYVVVDVLD